MQVLLGLLMAALVGVDETADSYAAPKTVVSRAGVLATKGGPIVGFRDSRHPGVQPRMAGKAHLANAAGHPPGRDCRLVARSGRLQGASRALPGRSQE